MRVAAPNKDYSGRVGRDIFVDGVCEDASQEQRPYYERHGYDIDQIDNDVQDDDGEKGLDKPKSDASKADVVAYAQHLGLDTDSLTKDQLWEAITQREATPEP